MTSPHANRLAGTPAGARFAHELARRVSETNTTPIENALPSLLEVVATANYWKSHDAGESFPVDEVVAIIDEAVTHPAWSEWKASLQLDHIGSVSSAPRSLAARSNTKAVHALQVMEERQEFELAQRTGSPKPTTGSWWSSPVFSDVLRTSAPLAELPLLGLFAREDQDPWTSAWITWWRPLEEPRVYEIRSPGDWASLVAEFPFDVSESRRPDWDRFTGTSSRWVIPNWELVGNEFDAVHVSADAYLRTAGVVSIVPGGATMLSGWDPECTYWLSDILEPAAAPTSWSHG